MIRKDESPAEKTTSTEGRVRTLLRRHVLKLTEVLLTPECHDMIEQNIMQMVIMLRFLQAEARRKKRSPEYTKFCESILAETAAADIGSLSKLGEADLDAFEKLLDTIVSGMANRPPSFDKLDPTSFVSLQKKILVPPKKRGPKYQPSYDDAFLRHRKGESTAAIARELEPEAFAEDPVATIQRYSTAFERRRERPAKRPNST